MEVRGAGDNKCVSDSIMWGTRGWRMEIGDIKFVQKASLTTQKAPSVGYEAA